VEQTDGQVVRIESIVHGGEGLARVDRRVVLVPLVVPGDTVRVALEREQGGVQRGRLLALLEPGPERVTPPCPEAGHCGGCDLQQLAPSGQQAAKAQVVAEALRRVGRFDALADVLQPLVPSPQSERYRRRLRVRLVGDGIGFSVRGSHKAVRVAQCLLAEPEVESLALRLAPLLRKAGLPPILSLGVDVTGGRGAVHVELGETPTPSVQARAGRLLGQVAGLAGLVLSGPDGKPVTVGDPVLIDTEHHRLRIRPDLFAQANRLGAQRLAADVAATVTPGARVLELYAGSGTLTLALASRAGALVASEGEGPALTLLRAALAENSHTARLIGGPAGRVATGLAAEGLRFDQLVLDPPRAGAREALDAIVRLAPARITYVSCDPATFARDARRLVDAGWQLRHVTPYDLFPHTHHVELMAVLERPSDG